MASAWQERFRRLGRLGGRGAVIGPASSKWIHVRALIIVRESGPSHYGALHAHAQVRVIPIPGLDRLPLRHHCSHQFDRPTRHLTFFPFRPLLLTRWRRHLGGAPRLQQWRRARAACASTASPFLRSFPYGPATGPDLPWDKPDPGCQGAARTRKLDVSNGGSSCGCRDHADAGDRLQPQADLAGPVGCSNGLFDRLSAYLQIIDLAHDQLDTAANRIGEEGCGHALGKRMQLRDAPDSLGRDKSRIHRAASWIAPFLK